MWHSLKAPEQDSEGKRYNCRGKCKLHLHNSEDFGYIYTSKQSVGLVIANGNVGE